MALQSRDVPFGICLTAAGRSLPSLAECRHVPLAAPAIAYANLVTANKGTSLLFSRREPKSDQESESKRRILSAADRHDAETKQWAKNMLDVIHRSKFIEPHAAANAIASMISDSSHTPSASTKSP